MFSYQKKVPVGELAVGMYVFQLDRSWNGTPFPLQGFHIKDESDISLLTKYCKQVTIDIARSDIRSARKNTAEQERSKSITRGKYHSTLELKPFVYPVKTDFNTEVRKARSVYKDLKQSITQLSESVGSNGAFNVSATMKASSKVVKSVLNNPDAVIWVMKLKHQTNDIYQHTMNCAVWAAVLGREIGLKEKRLEHLVTGVLLSKIGLTMLREEMAGMPFHEFQLTADYFHHIDYAINMLATDKSLPPAVIETIINHEERYDGSGFPNELQGDQIPLYAQIAGVVDTYESMTSPLLRKEPLAPGDAVCLLYGTRGHEFDNKLVESFIQVLGIYPPGTLIELNTQELAIVTRADRDKRIQPNVLLVTDARKQPRKKPVTLDMHAFNRSVMQNNRTGKRLEIVKSLPAGSFNIWPHQFNYQQDSLLEKLLG